MTIKELIKLIEQWAIDRGLDKNGTVKGQLIKTAEEVAELIIAISKDDMDGIKDAVGDVFITLVVGNLIDNHYDFYDLYTEATSAIMRKLDFKFIKNRLGAKVTDDKNIAVAHSSMIPFMLYCYGYRASETKTAIDDMDGIATHYGFTLTECVESAYNEIADRKGRVINGTFVKESDLVE